MSYQVLARKWRPSTFAEMVGQAHVLKALVNSLDQQRLHHAYLFTGTRGVGKTTIARLLAKSLNCELGVSSKPCGQCSACVEIAEGRFVDLIEVDAASRTRVEDTRELLENVQYAPTRGRYKVYLIDEVHMLSVSSFNALLKTLEEPPPHVKFLLATTDPQKLPVTVLSRCLQFNLKNMTRESIVGYLEYILKLEAVPFDEPVLWLLAEAANGSMRDALSLTDQAIAYGEGELRETDVATMLGTVDLKRVLHLVKGLIEKDADDLMQQVATIAEHSPDYRSLLNELLSSLHRVAIAQAAPAALDNSRGDRGAVAALASAAQAEDVHLFYQIGTLAAKDLALAPSERAGFEMALLRMLAFSPSPAQNVDALPSLESRKAPEHDGTAAERADDPENSPESNSVPGATPASPSGMPGPYGDPVSAQSASVNTSTEPPESDVATVLVDEAASPEGRSTDEEQVPPHQSDESGLADRETTLRPGETGGAPLTVEAPQAARRADSDRLGDAGQYSEPKQPVESAPTVEPPDSAVPLSDSESGMARQDNTASTAGGANDPLGLVHPEDNPARWPDTDLDTDPVFWWQVTLHKLGLSGMTKTLFAHSEWAGFENHRCQLVISENYQKLMNETHVDRLIDVLGAFLPDVAGLDYQFGVAEKTPQAWFDRLHNSAHEMAVVALSEDPFVQSLISDYAGDLQTETVKPAHSPLPPVS